MKILLCHNHYQQPGGEDQVFADEATLLEAHGHQVVRFTQHNDAIETMSRWQVAGRTLWNRKSYAALRGLIRRERPQLMHCTNTFPLISPAAYYAARGERVPVVQSLHNYRLLCPNSLFLRNGRVCEKCLGMTVPLPAAVHGCYRGSRAASAVVAAMSGVHRLAGTWNRAVDTYVVLTEFARRKFIAGGLPANKIVVKPNFVDPDPGVGNGAGGYAVFIGRLSEEKGVDTLLEAWSHLPDRVPLKIVGDGPLLANVQQAADGDDRIEILGRQPMPEVLSILGDAACLIVPSICYEGLPKTMVESFAKGTPVIASRIGSLTELIDDGRNGLHAEPGSAEDLAAKVQQLFADPCQTQQMRQAARREYELKYTAEQNYRMLIEIYDRALGVASPAPANHLQPQNV